MQLILARGGAVKERALTELQLLTVDDTAAKLGISVRTVRRLVKSGALVAHRITSHIVRVDAQSVTRLLENTRVAGSHGDSACPSENEGTSTASRTSSGSVVAARRGRATSPGTERSPSAPATQPKPSDDSMPLPQNATELRLALRQLRRPS